MHNIAHNHWIALSQGTDLCMEIGDPVNIVMQSNDGSSVFRYLPDFSWTFIKNITYAISAVIKVL